MYRMQAPNRVRDPRRPMQVLCLGLSRSGTDSLRKALQILGFDDIYHAFVITEKQRSDAVFWTPLIRRKLAGQAIGQPDFDSVLGNVQAVTDVPTAILGQELMEYYPHAKVILNRRRDVDAWERSMKQTCISALSRSMWTIRWFDASVYHLWQLFHACNLGYYGYDFDRNGKRVYAEHFAALEADLQKNRRPWLDWTVEEGWEPLCEFLGREIPHVPFPNGNRVGREFDGKMKDITKDMALNAMRNMAFCVVGAIALVMSVRYH